MVHIFYEWLFGALKSPVTPESKTEMQRVRFKVARQAPQCFQLRGCSVIGQVRSQARGRPDFQLHLNPFVLRLSPGQQRNQEVRSLKRTHPKYASYTWVIPYKPTARATQKDVFNNKKRRKIWSLQKTNYCRLFYYFKLISMFTFLIHFTKRFKRVTESDECFHIET